MDIRLEIIQNVKEQLQGRVDQDALEVIQDVLGHADVSTTMNIYVDVTNELKKNELKSFSAYMEGA